MSVERLLVNSNTSMVVDLKNYNTFADMKAELEQRLKKTNASLLGNRVSIDIGSKRLTERQFRELEDILHERGLHLKKLMNNHPPGDREVLDAMVSRGDYEDEIADSEDTVLICRNLRSGQKFFARGSLVILGDINPGAEVVAGGNILVMGALRGIAHAGAFGEEESVIAAYRLNPTQLRISNHITRPPDGEKVKSTNPEMARIREGKVVIEKLKI